MTYLKFLQFNINEKKLQTSFTIQGKWYSQILHPETSDKV